MNYVYRYPRPAVTTDALVYYREGSVVRVLLIQRGREPFQGKWALPGGFINMDERLETACKRELEEETGLKLDAMVPYRVYDAVDRDPRHRTISVVFYTEVAGEMPVTGGDDAAIARWFPLHVLPEMAFDHREIIEAFFEQDEPS